MDTSEICAVIRLLANAVRDDGTFVLQKLARLCKLAHEAFDWIFLFLYTAEMMLKIMGFGIIFGLNAYL